MDFDLSEEQALLQDSVTKLLAGSYSLEQRAQYRQATDGYSRDAWRQFADLGLLALPFSAEDGGLGGGAVDVMLLMESFGRHLVLEPYFATVVLAGGCIRYGATAAQRAALLPHLIAGDSRYALAHVERAARFDLAQVETRARPVGAERPRATEPAARGDVSADRDASAGWILEGAKAYVLHGDSADRFIVSARTSGGPREESGVGLFVVDASNAGVRRRGYATQDGGRAADLVLEGVRVPADALLGSSSDGLATLRRVIDEAQAASCAEAVGAMSRALEITVEYLKQRKQFGVAIASFQALQHRAVDMLVMVEQARSMTYYAAMSVAEPDSRRRAAAISAARIQVNRAARFVGEQAIQLHGGIGMTLECAIGHYYRRLTMLELQFGDTPHHLETLTRAGGVTLDG